MNTCGAVHPRSGRRCCLRLGHAEPHETWWNEEGRWYDVQQWYGILHMRVLHDFVNQTQRCDEMILRAILEDWKDEDLRIMRAERAILNEVLAALR